MAPSKAKRAKKKAARVKTTGAKSSASATPPTAGGVQTTDPGTAEELADIDAIEVDIASFEDGEAGGDLDVDVDVADLVAQRRSERVHLDEKVEIRGVFGGGAGDLTVRDASLHGVFVETAYLLEVGDPVSILFPVEGGGRLTVSGRVRWVTPFGSLRDARPGMGIELTTLGASARDALSALLYKRKQSA
jgi:hypothetical protein